MISSIAKLDVFTIDDSEIVYKNMRNFLAEHNNTNWIGHAFTIAEAFNKLAEKLPDVIILDIHLKTESSFDFLDHINKNYPEIIVIMFTNLSTPPYRQKCEKLGAKYFLDKSEDFEQIPHIISELLNNKK